MSKETKKQDRINLLYHFWFTAFIFQLIFTNNTAIESYEHVDLKSKNDIEHLTFQCEG